MPNQYPQHPPSMPQGNMAPQSEPSDLSLTRQSRRRTWLLAGLVLVVVFAIGGLAALYTSHQPTATPATNTTPAQTSQSQNTANPSQASSAGNSLATYVSNGSDLGLRFSYPSSWSVTPPSNSNSSDQPITVTSPVVSIESATGTTATGKVVVSIRPGGTNASELAGDKATAGQASVQIGYDNPTPAQHQYPFLTFVHLSGDSNPQSTFEELMVTGITSFAKDQAIPQAMATAFDPLVTVQFYACATTACTSGATPLSLTNAAWNSNPTCQQALAIIKSLQIG